MSGWATSCRKIAWRTISLTKGREDLHWAAQLARAIQVSLVGFGVGGAFVNIGYWDLVYYEIVLLLAAFKLASTSSDTAKQRAVGAKSALVGSP